LKILLVGSNKHYAIERYYVKYLKELGAEVFHFPSADIVFDFHSKNIINKVLFHSKIYSAYGPVNRQLINVAHSFNPDIIWIFKGMEIYPETLAKLRKKFKLANYNPDHPFIFAGRGSGNNNVTKSIGLYHLHFCYQMSLQNQFEKEYGIPSVFLPFAFETTDMVYTHPDKIREIDKICFQANPDKYRVKKIEFLTEKGLEVDVYGVGWEKTRLRYNSKVKLLKIASRAEFWKKNQEYRVQLNLFRVHTLDSHNMRTFEIPAVGGIQLSPFSSEQALFFENNKEIFFFKDEEEMAARAETLLSLNWEEAKEVRTSARKRSLESGYTFADRAAIVLNTFQNLLW